MIEARHRLAMVESAIEGDLRFESCDMEIRRGGVSYAIDTVAELTEAHPRSRLYFVIGADTLPELHAWKSIYEILSLCTFVTFARPGSGLSGLAHGDLELEPPWPERLLANVAGGQQVDISSTDIRYRVAEGMSIRYLVPAAVEMYIAEHGLYTGAG